VVVAACRTRLLRNALEIIHSLVREGYFHRSLSIVVETFCKELTNLIGLMTASMASQMREMDDFHEGIDAVAPDRKTRAGKIAEAFYRGHWLRGYIRGKLLADPVFDVALESIREKGGCVIDLGCGLGLLGFWIKIDGSPVSYKGCDLGGWKINEGRAAAQRMGYESMTLHEADLMEFPLENASVICAFDILHYLPEEQQGKLIRRLAQAAKEGSLVLLRNGVRECGWRSVVTLLEEWWTRCSGWISGGQINFPRLESLIAEFEKEGCSVEARPLWGKTPFSSYLLRIVSRH